MESGSLAPPPLPFTADIEQALEQSNGQEQWNKPAFS